jgi:hypothetical protein
VERAIWGEDMVDSAGNANGPGKSDTPMLDRRSVACAWCAAPFEDAIRGDRGKVFCSTPCRMAFHKAARQWAEREFIGGRVSARELHAVSPPCTAQRLAPESEELCPLPPNPRLTSGPPGGF